SVDAQAIYLVRGQTLAALSLENGRVMWEKPFSGPKGTWKTTLLGRKQQAGDVLLVYPDQIPARRWEFCWLWGSLQWIVGYAPEAQPGKGCPVHCLEPGTGQLIQRLNLPAGLPQLVGPERTKAGDRLRLQPAIRTREMLVPSELKVRPGETGL